MSKIKVLTVQYDITHLSQDAINTLRFILETEGEDFEVMSNGDGTLEYASADVLNSSIREVDSEDV